MRLSVPTLRDCERKIVESRKVYLFTKNSCKRITVNLQLNYTPPAPLKRGVLEVVKSKVIKSKVDPSEANRRSKTLSNERVFLFIRVFETCRKAQKFCFKLREGWERLPRNPDSPVSSRL